MRPGRISRRWWQRSWLWLCAFVSMVACATFVPQQGWNPATGPVVPHDSFPADCSLCHLGDDWRTLRPDFTFDHAARTGVLLEGAHAQAHCLLCHNDRGPVQSFAARGCAGCHADPHFGRLGATCADCHDERTWQPRQAIAMHDRTRLPLVGAHAATACFRCHPGALVGNFAGQSSACAHCHQADYLRTSNPNHVTSNFSQDCARCHTPLGWQPARFDHPASFPLTLGHAGRRCSECHQGQVFTGTPSDCVACHLDTWQATQNPPHASFQMSQQCQDCHGTASFGTSNFSHPFPIASGRHQGLACFDCHDNAGNRLLFSCVGCHEHRQSEMADKHDDVPGYVFVSSSCFACHPDGRR